MLDTGLITREIRKLFSQEMGIAPEGVHKSGTVNHLRTGSSTGMTTPAFLDTLEMVEDIIEEKIGRRIKLPVDVPGADFLLLHNAGEFLAWPEKPRRLRDSV